MKLSKWVGSIPGFPHPGDIVGWGSTAALSRSTCQSRRYYRSAHGEHSVFPERQGRGDIRVGTDAVTQKDPIIRCRARVMPHPSRSSVQWQEPERSAIAAMSASCRGIPRAWDRHQPGNGAGAIGGLDTLGAVHHPCPVHRMSSRVNELARRQASLLIPGSSAQPIAYVPDRDSPGSRSADLCRPDLAYRQMPPTQLPPPRVRVPAGHAVPAGSQALWRMLVLHWQWQQLALLVHGSEFPAQQVHLRLPCTPDTAPCRNSRRRGREPRSRSHTLRSCRPGYRDSPSRRTSRGETREGGLSPAIPGRLSSFASRPFSLGGARTCRSPRKLPSEDDPGEKSRQATAGVDAADGPRARIKAICIRPLVLSGAVPTAR